MSLAKVSGYVQKGPYLNGTNITISELSTQLDPTGKIFTSQIIDNQGTFEITNVELASHYVELKADGFYFNEVTNKNSTSQLTLFALSDLSDKTSLNVNILSTLEKNNHNKIAAKLHLCPTNRLTALTSTLFQPFFSLIGTGGRIQ